MSRKILFPVIIILLVLGFIYLFIPSTIYISRKIEVASNQQATLRNLADLKNWNQWWPGQVVNINGELNLFYKNKRYQIDKHTYSGFDLNISDKLWNTPGHLNFIPSRLDSTEIEWFSKIDNDFNPFTRSENYLKAKELSKNYDSILKHLKLFIEKRENLYGYDIKEINVVDTNLVAIKIVIPSYPSNEKIYDLINQLKKYIIENNARQVNFPMLHIDKIDSLHFRTMVAIPVDRELPGHGEINYKRMVAGNILVTEVKGGPAKIKNAYLQLENFMSDFHRLSPAIPFESLITDRMLVKDTSQWKTKVYYPVY